MRALVLRDFSGPDGLALVDMPEPEAAGRVLIDVHAAGVSFADVLITQGRYQVRPPLPFVPGMEVAGRVRSAPDGSGLTPGERVAAFPFVGAFAEVVAAAPERTFVLPASLDYEAAAGFIVNYQSAWFALERRARLRPGETVLVQGAGGGLGVAAVEVAKALGARVIAVASSDAKRAAARQAGADLVVDPAGPWRAEATAWAGGRGIDVVLDPVGGERTDESLRCLAPEGRLVVVGFTSGTIPAVKVNRLLLRNVSVVGSAWREHLEVEPAWGREAHAALSALAERGLLRPVVSARYPLEQGAQALKDIAERRASGKVVLTVRAEARRSGGPGGA